MCMVTFAFLSSYIYDVYLFLQLTTYISILPTFYLNNLLWDPKYMYYFEKLQFRNGHG